MPVLDYDASIEFEVYCARCGKGLCGETEVNYKKAVPSVIVGPCSNCLDDEYNKGREIGYDEGYGEGYDKAICEHEQADN